MSNRQFLAIHGLPTGPGLWGRLGLDVEAPALSGVGTAAPSACTLDGWMSELRQLLNGDTVLVGHDLGGVLAAMLAAERAAAGQRVAGLALSGTSLSPAYWAAVRASAWPGLWRYFYRRHGGRRFLLGGMAAERHAEALSAFGLALDGFTPGGLSPGHPAAIPDLPARMRATAAGMRLPAGLTGRLRAGGFPIRLIWGRRDPWYPLWMARRLAADLGAGLATVEAGHLAPWEAPEAFAAALRAVWPDLPDQGGV